MKWQQWMNKVELRWVMTDDNELRRLYRQIIYASRKLRYENLHSYLTLPVNSDTRVDALWPATNNDDFKHQKSDNIFYPYFLSH